MTPREYAVESEAARQRWCEEHEQGIALAWRSAVLYAQAMVGKLQNLDVVLAQSRGESGRQTAEQQMAQVTTLSKLTGFPLRPASPETLAKLRPTVSDGR